MALIDCSFYSECLQRPTDVHIVIPKIDGMDYAKPLPTLYMLHGLMDCATNWIRRTSLERYCDDFGLAVVLPEASRSWYCDMKYGEKFFTHIAYEVPKFCKEMFNVFRDPDKCFIAGNSMGGFGACKIALKVPGMFSKVGILSGALDIFETMKIIDDPYMWNLCYGGQPGPEEDIFTLVKTAARNGTLPELFQYCGTDDIFWKMNERFAAFCAEQKIPLTTDFVEGEHHDWDHWDIRLPDMFRWMLR